MGLSALSGVRAVRAEGKLFINLPFFVSNSVIRCSNLKSIFFIRKASGSREPLLSNSVDPLFYLSSFQTLLRNPGAYPGCRGFLCPSERKRNVHKFVAFCFQFLYWAFKSRKYPNIRKVSGSREPLLSNSVDPLFYLSSFQTLSREPRYLRRYRGFPCSRVPERPPKQESKLLLHNFLTFFSAVV